MVWKLCWKICFVLFVVFLVPGFRVQADEGGANFGLVPPVTVGPVKELPEGPLPAVPKLDPIQPTQKEYECFNLINEARANPSLYGYGSYSPAPPLHWNAALLYIGWVHSKDMYEDDYFQHDSYNRVGGNLVFDRSWSDRVKSAYPYNTTISENIAWNTSGTAQDAVTAWMNSPPHRETIMNANLTEGAIGIYGGSDKVYFTHDFGARTISYNLALNSAEVSLNPPEPQPGETVRVTFVVHNAGVTDAFPVEVQAYRRSPGESWVEVTEVLWLQNILEGGKNASVYIDVETSGYARGTDLRIGVDPRNLFAETSESDNSADRVLIPEGGNLAGDLNGDGLLDGEDLFRFSLGWHLFDNACNLDTQGTVDCRDLAILMEALE